MFATSYHLNAWTNFDKMWNIGGSYPAHNKEVIQSAKRNCLYVFVTTFMLALEVNDIFFCEIAHNEYLI